MSFEEAANALADAGQDDCTIRQTRILLAIHKGYGEPPRTVRGIAGHLGVPPSSITRACDRFIDGDLVTREKDSADHRSVVLGLTPAGKELARRLAA